MGKITTSSAQTSSPEASNYDEIFMKQSLLFDDSLKDLKNLSTQLYSAAEYFELSYTNDDQQQIVIETLKDYAIRALVNTVDHLGSVTYKVNDMLDEKVVEVSGTELRVSCIEQTIKTCQDHMDHEGRIEQSLVISTPKYHKRYILPVGETKHDANRTKPKYVGCSLDDEDEWHRFRNAVRATIRETPTYTVSKGRSPSPSLRPQRPEAFSSSSTVPKKDLDKRAVSPHRFPFLSTGSLSSSRPTTPKSSRPATPKSSRPTTPNSSSARQRYHYVPHKSTSMQLQAERDNGKDEEEYPSKSKRLFKALLGRRKSKKDDVLYTYLDEY